MSAGLMDPPERVFIIIGLLINGILKMEYFRTLRLGTSAIRLTDFSSVSQIPITHVPSRDGLLR
jgi:hypothetical protein